MTAPLPALPSIRAAIRTLTRTASAPFSCPVTVEEVTPVSAGFVRVAVSGDGLADYRDVLPADAFKLFLPEDGTGPVAFPERGEDGLPSWPDGVRPPVLRPFTVRTFDGSLLRFDVALHDAGVAMRWVRATSPGDVVGLSGMRREFHAGAGVDRHLLVGDATALPAVAAIVESLPAGTPVTAYLAVADPSDQALLPVPDGVTVHWVPDLVRAVRDGERPGGRVQAWLAAEASVVRDLRRHVVDTLHVARDDLHAAAYWKRGMNSTQTDAVLLDRYREEVAAGADATDPDVRERVELRV